MLIEQTSEDIIDPNADDVDAAFDCLVAQLEGVSRFRDAVDRLAEIDREEALRFAERAEIYAELLAQNFAEQGPGVSRELAFRSLAAELAIANRLSDRTIQSRLSEALALVDDFSFTLHALQGGMVSVAHARVVMAELVLTGEATGDPHAGLDGIRAEVAIVIPALTLLDEGSEPASILGRGPIGLAEALLLAAGAPSLVRVITDPVTDHVLATDNYRPSERLRRYLRWRDGRCRFPLCNRSPGRCDIDHTVPYSQGGTTEADNLSHLCQGHHTIKHLPGWSLRQIEPGVLQWVSPHGIVVTDRPDTPVRFVEN